ncbi:MAG: DUF1638 domain-containing protein [Chloroflexi bacterium]|nr:DUF1638 domain-containing protein [Chloroflexota bacterium]
MTTGLIICGALGREVVALIKKHGWDAQVIGIPAVDHVFPQRIAPDVEKRILELSEQFDRLIVVFGDCGSRGALDEILARYPDIERIAGPHCYEMYGGELFEQLITEEPGTYILTDFMVRTFQGLILKSMGLHKYPQLKGEYFKNYKRVVYLAQSEDPKLIQKAHRVAAYLELPLEIRYTGFGLLEERLIAMMQQN